MGEVLRHVVDGLDIVIPVKASPDNECVNYALASIARFYPGRRVFLIGGQPSLDSHELNVTCISTRQGDNRYVNTDLAMRVALDNDDVNDPFIWSNDDIYWMRPADPIRWAIGKLEDVRGGGIFRRRKRATGELLASLSLPTFDYETHVPIAVDKRHMSEALDIGGDKRSVYGNLTGLPDIVAHDVKLRNPQNRPGDWPWISTQGSPAQWPGLLERLSAPRDHAADNEHRENDDQNAGHGSTLSTSRR